jgi:succinate dehydrogenase / fumarate reductase cytochrome b subunit
MESRAHPNRLGIRGWVGGGRWGFERYLYTLHRLTGLGLLAYFLMHIVVTSARVFGPESWRRAMDAVQGPAFRAGEYLVFAAFAFHAVNGIRLGMVELGFWVGRPIEPIYPDATSVGRQRPLAVAALLIAGALAVWGGYNFLIVS